ncbi:hypothetical protein ACFX13_018437 [Malus domestica]
MITNAKTSSFRLARRERRNRDLGIGIKAELVEHNATVYSRSNASSFWTTAAGIGLVYGLVLPEHCDDGVWVF